MQRNGQDVRTLPDDVILTPSARDFLRDFETNGKSHVNGAKANAVSDGKSTAPAKPLNSKSSKAELEAIGYRVAIFPATTGLASAYAAEVALSVLKESGTSISPTVRLFSFSEFNSLIGFEDVWEFERKWGATG